MVVYSVSVKKWHLIPYFHLYGEAGKGMGRMGCRQRYWEHSFSLGHFKHNKTVLRGFSPTAAKVQELCLSCCGIFFKNMSYQSQSLVQRVQTWDKWVRRVLPCEEGPRARTHPSAQQASWGGVWCADKSQMFSYYSLRIPVNNFFNPTNSN